MKTEKTRLQLLPGPEALELEQFWDQGAWGRGTGDAFHALKLLFEDHS